MEPSWNQAAASLSYRHRPYQPWDAPIMDKPENKPEITLEELERYAAQMVQALPHLDCPECCEQGWKYQYVELSAGLYREEFEWHCLAVAIHARRKKQNPGS